MRLCRLGWIFALVAGNDEDTAKPDKTPAWEWRGLVKYMSVGMSAATATLAAGVLVLAGCSARAPATDAPSPPRVTVSKPVVREVTDYFEFPGRTEAVSEVQIRARVTGYITKVNFEDGQDVKKGQLLFEIDPRPYQAILDRANGELARLEAVREKAQVDLARSERLRPRAPSARMNMNSTSPN